VCPSLSVALPRVEVSTDLSVLERNVVRGYRGGRLRAGLFAGHFSPGFLPIVPRTEQDNVPGESANPLGNESAPQVRSRYRSVGCSFFVTNSVWRHKGVFADVISCTPGLP